MVAGLEVADIFRRHGEDYRQTHDIHLGRVERRVMSVIEMCRTARLGGHVQQCQDCEALRIAYDSCRNRHCPKMGERPAAIGLPPGRPTCCRRLFSYRLHRAASDRRDCLPLQADSQCDPVSHRRRDYADLPPIPDIWVPRSASLPCCIPGGRICIITRISTACAGRRIVVRSNPLAGLYRRNFFLPVRVLARLSRRCFSNT